MSSAPKHPLLASLVATSIGPTPHDTEAPAWTTKMEFGAAEHRDWFVRHLRPAVIACDRGNPKPLIRLLERRPELMSVGLVLELVDHWRRRNDEMARVAAGEHRRGRPASVSNAHILYYVNFTRKKFNFTSDRQAIQYLAEHKEASPLRSKSADDLRRIYYRAKNDPRYQPMAIWDITREELLGPSSDPERR